MPDALSNANLSIEAINTMVYLQQVFLWRITALARCGGLMLQTE